MKKILVNLVIQIVWMDNVLKVTTNIHVYNVQTINYFTQTLVTITYSNALVVLKIV